MKEIGIVQSITGNNAIVMIQRSAACGDCGACQVGKEKLTMEAKAVNKANANVGDRVEVEMAFKDVMKASLIVYTIPLIMFILGCVLGSVVGNNAFGSGENPIFSFFSGLLFTLISYAVIKILDKKGIFSSKYEPQITTIVESLK